IVANQEAPDQICGSHVIVTGHRHQWPAQTPGHVLDETGLAAAGRPLEHYRQLLGVALLEDRYLISSRLVPGLLSDSRQWLGRGGLSTKHIHVCHRPGRTASAGASAGSESSTLKRGGWRKKSQMNRPTP